MERLLERSRRWWTSNPRRRISELFPHLSKHADELCLINSMHTELPAHAQSFLKLHTGNSQFVRPSLGAWTLYGLGTVNENLRGRGRDRVV